MVQKKDDLLTEELSEDSGAIVLFDERGNALTKEEALIEEEKLNSLLENFFVNNFYQSQVACEEEDDDAVIATIDEKGEVLDERKVEPTRNIIASGQITIASELPLAAPKMSMFEQSLLKNVIRKHIIKMSNSYDAILKIENEFYSLSEGSALFDNISDAYRRERNELQSLLFIPEDISLDKLTNEKLKRTIQKDMNDLAENLVDIITSFTE